MSLLRLQAPGAARVNLTFSVSTALIEIFEREYRELRPRAPIPPLDIRFRRFTSLNTTIRLREGRLIVRLSDLLEFAPESVHHAIAHILLAKLYKKPIARAHADRYRRHTFRRRRWRGKPNTFARRAGARRFSRRRGHHYDLDEVFESLNTRFFHGLLGEADADLERAPCTADAGPLRCGAQHDHGEPRL